VRSLGQVLILCGALGAAVGLFVPVYSIGGEDFTWWEYVDGLDIALLAACAIAAGLAIAGLITDRPAVERLAVVGGGMTFGISFALIPIALLDTDFYRAGMWIVGAGGGIALAGAVLTAITGGRQVSSPARFRSVGVAVTMAGVVAVAAMAIANPFAGVTEGRRNEVPDVHDAATLTREWAAEHQRPGERFVHEGCKGDQTLFESRFACLIRFEPTKRVVTVYVRTENETVPALQRVVQVRRGEHPLPYP
jgi:hypothetical protein